MNAKVIGVLITIKLITNYWKATTLEQKHG